MIRILPLLFIVAASCRGPRLTALPEEPPVPRPLPAEDVDAALAKFPTADGAGSARRLSQHPKAAVTAVPRVIAMFRKSLEESISTTDVRGRWLPSPHVVYLRRSCYVFFEAVGPAAQAVAPDALDLLRRREMNGEFAGPRFTIEQVIAAVSREDPEHLIQASRDGSPKVREACCRAMGFMKAAPESVGLALEDRLDDADMRVVMGAVRALGSLGRANWTIVAKLKDRYRKPVGPSYKDQLQRAVASFEADIAASRK